MPAAAACAGMLPHELERVQLALGCAQLLSAAAEGEEPQALEQALHAWEEYAAPGGRWLQARVLAQCRLMLCPCSACWHCRQAGMCSCRRDAMLACQQVIVMLHVRDAGSGIWQHCRTPVSRQPIAMQRGLWGPTTTVAGCS